MEGLGSGQKSSRCKASGLDWPKENFVTTSSNSWTTIPWKIQPSWAKIGYKDMTAPKSNLNLSGEPTPWSWATFLILLKAGGTFMPHVLIYTQLEQNLLPWALDPPLDMCFHNLRHLSNLPPSEGNAAKSLYFSRVTLTARLHSEPSLL